MPPDIGLNCPHGFDRKICETCELAREVLDLTKDYRGPSATSWQVIQDVILGVQKAARSALAGPMDWDGNGN